MKIVRTAKQFNKATLENEQDLVRKLVSLAGMHSSPLKGKWEDFTIEENFRGVTKGGACYPWKEKDAERGYIKELYAIDLDYKGFDCSATLYQTGTLGGRYTESGKPQYASNPLEVVNVLLQYGYVEVVVEADYTQDENEKEE